MLRLRAFIALTFTVTLAAAAHAAPVIDLSWNACSPIVHDRVLPPGATRSDLYVIGTGITGTHNAYQFKLFMGQTLVGNCAPSGVADAWRFDDGGCEGAASFTVTPTSNDAACPSLKGNGSYLSAYNMYYDPLAAQLTLTLGILYPDAPQTSDPNATYLLGHVTFDHSKAVTGPGNPPGTCGGFEKSMCITLWGGKDAQGNCYGPGEVHDSFYLKTDESVVPFGPGPASTTSFRIDPSITACAQATPVRPTTWGAVRGLYR